MTNQLQSVYYYQLLSCIDNLGNRNNKQFYVEKHLLPIILTEPFLFSWKLSSVNSYFNLQNR